MNKVTRPNELETPKVTTGALPASKKVHSAPNGRPDIAVPLREKPCTRGQHNDDGRSP